MPTKPIAVSVDLSKHNAEFHFNQAIALLDQGNLQAAIEALSFAIQINPQYTEAYAKRADIYMGLGDSQKAMADYSKSLGIWQGDRAN